ncbi:MAG: hypothetical protein ACREJC_00145 [Tepidisphaeraceae bacterium]
MLGFILAPLGEKVPGQFPSEIQNAYGGTGEYLCPFDPQFNQNGEAGLFYDTQLGGPQIPTDAELATVYGHTPVASGWIPAQEGYFPSPWRTPGGWNPAGAWGPQPSLSGTEPSPGMTMTPVTMIEDQGATVAPGPVTTSALYKFGMSPMLWGGVAALAGLGAFFYFRRK